MNVLRGLPGPFTMSGDVGGRRSFPVSGLTRRKLQIITVVLPATQTGEEFVIESAQFFLRDSEIWLEVVNMDEDLAVIDRWEASTGAGDLKPNFVIATTQPNRPRTLYLAVVAHNISRDESRLYPCDGWSIKFVMRQYRTC